MKAFFDTSVLIAAFFRDNNIHHRASVSRLAEYTPQTACCSAHSLAEVYSTLTRMPKGWRVSGEKANRFVSEVREHLSLVALDTNDYVQALDFAATHKIAGGSVYDALLAYAALKANAETIYTWNLRHFLLFGDDVASRTRNP